MRIEGRVVALAVGVLLASPAGAARAEGPVDLPSAVRGAFDGIDACVALRDVAPGAGTALNDEAVCARRMPPCATFELPAAVIALDRGVVPDAVTPVRRAPSQQGAAPEGVNLRDAFRRPEPWVFEEIARRVGSEALTKALAAMRYGNAETDEPVERLGRGESGGRGLVLSPVEQVDFLARLRRGELPTSTESQARTVELAPTERIGDVTFAWKTGACDGVAWAVGWVDRPQRSTIFAVAAAGEGRAPDDVLARTRRVMEQLTLIPPPR